jgi:hypothetical protein
VSGLREAWEEHAAAFIAWAREPGHDRYWRFHRDALLPLVHGRAGGEAGRLAASRSSVRRPSLCAARAMRGGSRAGPLPLVVGLEPGW